MQSLIPLTNALCSCGMTPAYNACLYNTLVLWDLMSIDFGTLTLHLVHPTLPVLLTKNGTLVTQHSVSGFRLSKSDFLPI